MKFLRPPLFSVLLLASIVAGAIFFLPHIHNAKASGPQTWYIRADGGTRYDANQPTGQCDGLANVAYPGTGVDQHCAFNDFRWLYDDQSYNNSAWVISGGDTVIVAGCASGENNIAPDCRIGWDAATGLGAGYTWCFGLGNCGTPVIPSGTPSQPTRILGANYTNCNNGNSVDDSKLSQIFAGFGLGSVLYLGDAQNVQIECIELTRHSECISNGSPAYPTGCDRGSPVFDDYVSNGIVTNSATGNILLQDMWIHGFTDAGVIGPIGGIVTANRVDIGYNGQAGWNFDNGNSTPSTGATWNFNNSIIEWSGCNQEYPLVDSFPAISCYDQNSGGYGDGVGTPANTGLNVNINNSIFRYNTQDGLDLGHIDSGSSALTVENSLFYGNMGGNLKWGPNELNATIKNNLVVANCNRMSAPLTGAPSTYNAYLSLFCRASDANSFNFRQGGIATLVDNTFVGYAPTTFDISCWDNSCSNSTLIFKNNIVRDYSLADTNDWYGGNSAPGLFYYQQPIGNLVEGNNIYYGIGHGFGCPTGYPNDICADPAFGNEPLGNASTFAESELDNFHFTLAPGSPAIGAGVSISGISTDYDGNPFANPPSIGALEYGSSATASGGPSVNSGSGSGGGSNPPPSDTTPPSTSITSPSNNATVSGNITIAASASDNVGVSSVALYIDGSPRATDASSPYSFSLDTTSLSNGSHTFVTKASDASGNVGTSGTITVTVSNVSGGGTSTSTPSSTPTGPSGYTFCSLEGTTCSFSGTESVAYGAGSSFNYLTLTNSTPCGNSIFTDPDSGVAKACFTKPSTPSSTPDTTPPTTSITAPISGGTLSGTASITASASDNVGITSVALVIDGSIQGTDNTAPYTFSLNTSNLSNGIHILATKAYDAAGNIGTSANVLVTVSNAVTPPPVSSGGGGGGGGGSNVVSTPSFNITSISISNLTPTTAQITITTNIPASVSLKYGLTTLYGNTTGVSPSLTTNYEKLTNLTPNTIYDFVVIATPPGGTQVISPVSTFKTLPMGGSTSSGGTGIAGSASSSISIGSSGSSLPAFTQNLAYGDTNSEVTLLQTILHTQGFLPGVLGITNYFGVQTEHALLLFQSAHDLNKSGFVDLQTQTLLNKIEAAQGNAGGVVVSTPVQTSPSTTSGSLTRNLAPGSVGPDVMILQHLLNQDGDYPQAIYSTHYGSLTEAAVKLFQAKYGLVNYGAPNTTGYGAVGPKTKIKLNNL